jgi:hypothetical protein
MRVCVFVNQIPLVKANERDREKGEKKNRDKKRKVGVIHLDESVCVCAFHILSIQTLIFAILMMFN